MGHFVLYNPVNVNYIDPYDANIIRPARGYSSGVERRIRKCTPYLTSLTVSDRKAEQKVLLECLNDDTVCPILERVEMAFDNKRAPYFLALFSIRRVREFDVKVPNGLYDARSAILSMLARTHLERLILRNMPTVDTVIMAEIVRNLPTLKYLEIHATIDVITSAPLVVPSNTHIESLTLALDSKVDATQFYTDTFSLFPSLTSLGLIFEGRATGCATGLSQALFLANLTSFSLYMKTMSSEILELMCPLLSQMSRLRALHISTYRGVRLSHIITFTNEALKISSLREYKLTCVDLSEESTEVEGTVPADCQLHALSFRFQVVHPENEPLLERFYRQCAALPLQHFGWDVSPWHMAPRMFVDRVNFAHIITELSYTEPPNGTTNVLQLVSACVNLKTLALDADLSALPKKYKISAPLETISLRAPNRQTIEVFDFLQALMLPEYVRTLRMRCLIKTAPFALALKKQLSRLINVETLELVYPWVSVEEPNAFVDMFPAMSSLQMASIRIQPQPANYTPIFDALRRSPSLECLVFEIEERDLSSEESAAFTALLDQTQLVQVNLVTNFSPLNPVINRFCTRNTRNLYKKRRSLVHTILDSSSRFETGIHYAQ